MEDFANLSSRAKNAVNPRNEDDGTFSKVISSS